MSVIDKPIEEETVEVPDSLPEVDLATQILIGAKTYIMEHGWSSNGPTGPTGQMCVVLAVSHISVYSRDSSGRACLEAWNRFQKVNNIHNSDTSTWNDTPGRTLEEVYEAFDRAIAYTEQNSRI